MSTIRKISGLVILTAFVFAPLFAETAAKRNYGFSLSPYFGALYGRSEEIVYQDPPRQNFYLSELLWDLKPLLYTGIGADLRPLDSSVRQGSFAELSFRAGLPARTGIIENRDWQNPGETFLTDYSRHAAHSRTAFLLDVSAGYFWRFFEPLALNVYGEFSYMHFSWSALDGYGQYANPSQWNSNLPALIFSGEVLRYAQNWFILSPGVSLAWDMNRLFALETHFSYTPLIFCSARDDHLERNLTFRDYVRFGHYVKFGGGLILSPSYNTDVSLFASYKRITGTRGDSYTGGEIAYNGAGAALSALDFGLAVKFRLTGRE